MEVVFQHLITEGNIRNIYLDGKKPKWYERNIKKVLRGKNMSVRKLRTVNARQYAGIRLADMIAGLVRSYFDGKNISKIEKYYRRLQKKIVIIIT